MKRRVNPRLKKQKGAASEDRGHKRRTWKGKNGAPGGNDLRTFLAEFVVKSSEFEAPLALAF